MPKKLAPEPCPFCRFNGFPSKTEIEPYLGSGYQVSCPRCKASGPVEANQTDAVTEWNNVAVLALKAIANTL